MKRKIRSRRYHWIEELEPRFVLSISFDSLTGDDAVAAADARGNAGGGKAPAIRLDLVALHELGHALGLDHTSDPNSIMYAYYNPNYDLSNFANDSVVPTLRSLYANVSTSPWKDSLDPTPGNGRVDVTFSFMPDGARMDKGTNSLFATFNSIFGSATVWEPVFVAQLNRWASVSGPDATHAHLAFVEHTDTGLAFNYSGNAQNDSGSGDIRIGSHRFDGAGNVLAHTYFPPPNGSTAAGDAHFDMGENWVLASGASSTSSSTSTSSTTGGSLTLAALQSVSSTERLGGVPATVVSAVMSDSRTTSTVTTPRVASKLATNFSGSLTKSETKGAGGHEKALEACPVTVAINRLSSAAVDLAFAASDLLHLLDRLTRG